MVAYDDSGMRKGPVITKEDQEDSENLVTAAVAAGNDQELKEDNSLLRAFAVAFQNDYQGYVPTTRMADALQRQLKARLTPGAHD